jgi:hypothetical protein
VNINNWKPMRAWRSTIFYGKREGIPNALKNGRKTLKDLLNLGFLGG